MIVVLTFLLFQQVSIRFLGLIIAETIIFGFKGVKIRVDTFLPVDFLLIKRDVIEVIVKDVILHVLRRLHCKLLRGLVLKVKLRGHDSTATVLINMPPAKHGSVLRKVGCLFPEHLTDLLIEKLLDFGQLLLSKLLLGAPSTLLRHLKQPSLLS